MKNKISAKELRIKIKTAQDKKNADNKKKYKTVLINLKNDEYEKLKNLAEEKEMTVNQYIKQKSLNKKI